MDFTIKQCVAWGGGLTTIQDWQSYAQGEISLSDAQELPPLKQIPAMQRRRLSPFAKLALHCALSAADECITTVPSVFASRHGDLIKTNKLINDVAAKEDLSPTLFGLSVHNAVGGLFSIYTGNKAPLTAISAGEDTFFTAIIDALCKLSANEYSQVLVVFTEILVPEIYKKYVAQDEVAIACALLLAPAGQGDEVYSLTLQANEDHQQIENKRMQVLDFLNFYYSNSKQVNVKSKRHSWQLNRAVS
ncbi:beta-ketoacyl synthase chain length factor [Colwellia sp. 12G3]|uniref:beta-ketoacyl synthase chain length factor n=1 Tax=Colwellia sp. 12G3 TaxID=2058299 RepID=UPI0012FF07B4|nr:beta-ketoacyl synthase chain length factor [Colwellia sp. 12G3]